MGPMEAMGAMGSMKTFNKPTWGGEDFKDCYTKVIQVSAGVFSTSVPAIIAL